MGANRRDVTCSRSTRQNVRQSIGHKIKKQGRRRISLSQAPTVRKEITGLAIDSHCRVATSDKLHQAVNHRTIEALGQQNLSKKTPAGRVLNWEKCHFVVEERIVLGHIISVEVLKLIKIKLKLYKDYLILGMLKELEVSCFL